MSRRALPGRGLICLRRVAHMPASRKSDTPPDDRANPHVSFRGTRTHRSCAELMGLVPALAMASNAYFSPATFEFLGELKTNNRREWFLANKQRYESEVRGPMLEFIAAFAPRLKAISRHYVADPRPNGGSMFRIYRDTRFSLDKSPYKTHLAAHFTHAASGDVHSPGFYLHLEPGEVFVASGIWHPDASTALKIRNAIAAQPKKWKAAIDSSDLKAKCGLGGEMLMRPPAGFAAHHPMIEELKRKDFIASASFDEADACSPRFIDRFSDICETTAPLMRFLTIALDLPW